MRKFIWISVILIGVTLLPGCAQTAATLSAEGTYLLGASIDYVHRVHDKRRSIEEMCWQSMMREIDGLRREDKSEAEVRALLFRSYPRPVTLAFIQKIQDDPSSILAQPPGCPIEETLAESPML